MIQRVALGAVLGVPVGAAAVTALAAWQGARRFVTPRRLPDKFITPWELGIPYEDVQFRTSDGLTLSGWWISHPDATRTVVTLTGHHGGRWDTIGIGSALWRRGMNVLLFDYRGRGASDPHINTLGYFETRDALAAVDFVHGRAPDTSIGLVGYSMGASIAIMAGARDTRVKAVVADSPFASQRQVIRLFVRRRWRLLPHFPFLYLMEAFLPYDVEDVEPIQEVSKIAPRALMLIHGERDTLCDPRDSDALYAAAGEPKEMWALPNVAHVGAYFADRDVYVTRVAAFLEKHLIEGTAEEPVTLQAGGMRHDGKEASG
ncbi:MAG: alpha/beta fold hydrolase [Chloroflexota bacterium]|nr:alpha/beta fold hydrolase [Chloroflexota bacterium]